MPRNVEDIIPSGKRSIRNIPIPEGRRKINLVEVLPPEQAATIPRRRATDPDPIPLPRIEPKHESFPPIHHKKSSHTALWIGMGIAIIALGLVIFSLFKGATLTYTPKSSLLVFDHDTYTAYKSGSGELLFSVIKLSDDKGAEAPASGGETVSTKASGQVIIYNNEKTSQTLVKTTRFQTTDGKIFRTPTDLTLPAGKTLNGGSLPGTLEVTLVADQPGADYNIGLSDFTLPGLKGSSRFTTIYARSKTAMTGGFVGTQKKVSDADLAVAKSTLETSLNAQLLTEAKAQVPADFILFPSLSSVSFDQLPQTNPTASSVTVNERGNFYGVMFKRTDLVAFLDSKKDSSNFTGTVNIPDLAALDFEPVNQNTSDLLKADQTTFQITGTTRAIAQTDKAALQKSLAGSKKSDLETVLGQYPSILEASAVIQPFWSSVFPSDPSKIKIVEKPLK